MLALHDHGGILQIKCGCLGVGAGNEVQGTWFVVNVKGPVFVYFRLILRNYQAGCICCYAVECASDQNEE